MFNYFKNSTNQNLPSNNNKNLISSKTFKEYIKFDFFVKRFLKLNFTKKQNKLF